MRCRRYRRTVNYWYAEQGRTMHPEDIIIWPDGFWCFREEFCADFLRDNNYRIVEHSADKWLQLLSKRPQPKRLNAAKPDKHLN